MNSETVQFDLNDTPVLVHPFLTVEEVSNLFRVPRTWVYSHAKEIPGYEKLGRYVRFRKADILYFLMGKGR